MNWANSVCKRADEPKLLLGERIKSEVITYGSIAEMAFKLITVFVDEYDSLLDPEVLELSSMLDVVGERVGPVED